MVPAVRGGAHGRPAAPAAQGPVAGETDVGESVSVCVWGGGSVCLGGVGGGVSQ